MRSALILLIVVAFHGVCSSPALAGDLHLVPGAHDIDIGEVRLHYVVRGHGPLVFVTSPGWGSGSGYLQKGLAPLESNLTLLFIDTCGSGESTRPADRSHMSTSIMADDIDALRESLGLETIILFGHSGGGTIAIEYAERHPQHVRKLVLVAPAVLGDRASELTDATLAGVAANSGSGSDHQWNGRLGLSSSRGAAVACGHCQFTTQSVCKQGAPPLDRSGATFFCGSFPVHP